ncbi:MAG: hypothetical protein P4L46_06990, partial [Fimbriimonas sp.]|nr:hypothetical protein [Fimbriimonas sp.]
MRAFAIALAALLVMGPALTHAQSHLTNHWAHYSTGTISKVAFSRDGRYRIVGGYGAIRVENAKTGIELRVLPTIADNVTSLAISPDGSTVADCGTIFNGPSVVELWNITSGRCIDCKLPIAAVNAIAYSPTGKTIVIGGAGLLQMWTVSPTFGILRSLVTSASSISSLTYSPSGATIAVGGTANSGGTLEVFDSVSAKRLYRLPTVASQSVTSVVYSPDGKFLVDSAVGEYLPYHGIATYTTTLESWNTVTGK